MRHLINFFITGFLMLVFQWIGWIKIAQELAPFSNPFANQLIVAGIVGLIFTVGMWLANLVFTLVVVGTCGLGCLLLPVYYLVLGPVGFWMVMKILPGWVSLNAETWQIVLMGILIAAIRIGAPKTSTSSSSSSSDN